MKKKIIWSLIGMLVVFQFVRPTRNEGTAYGAEDITHVMPVPREVKEILETSCFDCHSNHTNYPWYTNIQPIGIWMQSHVNDGREELNFSEFASYSAKRKNKKLKEIGEEIKEHEMPLESYLWIHEESALNEARLKVLTDWIQTSMASPAGNTDQED